MTTMIDHAIAIPTKHRNVWEQVSDISKNPIWQVDSEHIAFLNTLRNGKGVRWRNTAPSGREYVIEITAWYEGLGYEYTIVDGMKLLNNRGRIRLQDAPEGTVVQWTFSYDTKGLFGNLRNALGQKRSFDHDIVDSLRNLYSYIKELKGDETFSASDSKAFMKDAPDVDARVSYQPKYGSKLDEKKPKTDQYEAYKPPISIEEPPIAEGDTKPNPTLVPIQDEVVLIPDQEPEPSFLKGVPNVISPTIEEDFQVFIEEDTVSAEPISPINLRGDNALNLGDDIDTSKISVFEMFGIAKPSDTGQMPAIQIETPIPVDISSSEQAFHAPIKTPDVDPTGKRRRGLRAVLRERMTSIRLPQ